MHKLAKVKISIFIVVCFMMIIPLLILFSLVSGIIGSDNKNRVLPAIEENKVEEYKTSVEDTNINWADMIVFDTVRYENDFENTYPDSIAFDFLAVEYVKKHEKKIKDEDGGEHWVWIIADSGTLSSHESIIKFVRKELLEDLKKMRYHGEFITHFDPNNFRMIVEILKYFNGLEYNVGMGDGNTKYDITLSGKDLVDVMDEADFTEEQKEWAQTLVSENVVYLMFEDEFELPDHIIVTGENFFAWPTPNLCTVTSPYGWRKHPTTGKRSFHSGVDISGANALGKPVIAAADGVVIKIDNNNAIAGKNIRLKHMDEEGNEWQTRYCHLSKIKAHVGDKVVQGDVIGAVGSTGRSTGPHLHMEMKYRGQLLNPYPYIR